MNVLFLTHRLPYAPNRGDRIRAYHILRTLRGRAEVELVSLVHDAGEAAQAAEMAGLAEQVHVAPTGRFQNWLIGAVSLAGTTPLTHALLDSPVLPQIIRRILNERRPDVILAYCSGMARFALEPPLADLPLVIDLVDVDSLKWQALAAKAHYPMRWIYTREAKWLSRFEARAAGTAFATTVVNDRERDALAAVAPGARIEVVPVGVDYEHFKPRSVPSEVPEVVFCGVMDYAPNVEGAIWLSRDVWPLVLRRRPDARLKIVGSRPTIVVRDLASVEKNIEVTGEVPDVRPYLWNAAVATAPLQVARGVQTKVLEAVSAGLPAIVTPAVAGGLPADILPACHVVDASPDAFAEAIVHGLGRTPQDRRVLVDAIDFSGLSWEHRLEPLVTLLEAAARSAPRGR